MYQASPGRILVRPIVEEKTAGGLHLPVSHKDHKAMKGTVVSIGDPISDMVGRTVPVPFEEGATVLFGLLSGKPIHDGGEELRTLNHDEVLGYLKV